MNTQDTWSLGGREFTSRLFLGTGKFSSNAELSAAIQASGTELVTVALRRVEIGKEGQDEDILAAVPAGVKALTVHHSGDVSAVDGLLAGLRQKFPRVPLVIRELGPVLGIHIGTETIAVAWEE